MSIFNRRDEYQGIGQLYNMMDELDEHYEGRALRARTAPSRTSIAIKKDKDCMMDDGEKKNFNSVKCSRQSRRGRVQEDKRTAYIYTHGLFIT
jgi:hypothetical protein